jgi:aerobic-type carbon monoxide dehydrogenase small subunit (CoxS/CutS family)
MSEPIAFKLNGAPVRVSADGERKLLWVLRTELGLTGTKFGCGEAHCGACTVLRDGAAIRACMTPLRSVQGREVTTIEGLAHGEALHPLQAAFVEHDALQCGFCTPGMILGAAALLRKTPRPTREQIVAGMNHHLCRCGAYTRIIDAIAAAAGTK